MRCDGSARVCVCDFAGVRCSHDHVCTFPQTTVDLQVEYITLDHPASYYANADDTLASDVLDKFCAMSCSSFDDTGFIDTDADGYVDCLTVIAQTNTNVWTSHRTNVNVTQKVAGLGVSEFVLMDTAGANMGTQVTTANFRTAEGLNADSSRGIASITYTPGMVPTHEYLHTLGLKDLYVIGDTSGYTPVGIWDIMATTGGYSWPLAATREQLGWTSLGEAVTEAGEYTLCTAAAAGTSCGQIAADVAAQNGFLRCIDGELYFAYLNSGYNSITILHWDGSAWTQVDSLSGSFNGIAFDEAGGVPCLAVQNANTSTVDVYQLSGLLLSQMGSGIAYEWSASACTVCTLGDAPAVSFSNFGSSSTTSTYIFADGAWGSVESENGSYQIQTSAAGAADSDSYLVRFGQSGAKLLTFDGVTLQKSVTVSGLPSGVFAASACVRNGYLYAAVVSGTSSQSVGVWRTPLDDPGEFSQWGDTVVTPVVSNATATALISGGNLVVASGGYAKMRTVDVAHVYGRSLNLAGKIGLRVYIALPDALLANSSAYLLVDVAGEQYSVPLTSLEESSSVSHGLPVYFCEVPLKSIQMNDVVSVSVCDANGSTMRLEDANGIALEGSVYTASVGAYCASMRGKTTDAKLQDLMYKLQYYGGMAQQYFEYDVGNLASADITASEVDTSAVTAADLARWARKWSGSVEGLTYYGSSLELNDTTTVRHYFEVAEGYSIGDFAFSVSAPGESSVPYTLYQRDSYYVLDIVDVVSNKLDTTYTVVATLADDGALANDANGADTASLDTNVAPLRIEYSALSYCYSQLSKPSADVDAKLVELCKALYLYNVSADAYFD